MLVSSRTLAIIGSFAFFPAAIFVACDSDTAAPGPTIDGGTLTPGDGSPGFEDDGAVGDATNVLPGTIVQITAGHHHACARYASGALKCWGSNAFGMLGTGASTDESVRHRPATVVGINDATYVAAGPIQTCAVRAAGNVYCWGSNNIGASGGTILLTPTPIVTDADAGTLFAGAAEVRNAHDSWGCIRRTTGTVACWAGQNLQGRLGDGTTKERSYPSIDVAGLTDAVEIAKGEVHACARKATGQVVCWGLNNRGQVGNGAFGAAALAPETVIGVTDAIALGESQAATCLIRTNKTVACWGINHGGQLGTGKKDDDQSSPATVAGINDAKQLSGGGSHFCALRESGGVVCWGSNAYGQLGDGTEDVTTNLPTNVAGLTDAVEIASGWLFTCARRSTGAVVCWGANDKGQHGSGNVDHHFTPFEVPDL